MKDKQTYQEGLATYLTKIRPMIEFCSPVCGGLSIYAVYPQYLMEELDRVQSRSLRVIVLPRNNLTTLTERTNEARSR